MGPVARYPAILGFALGLAAAVAAGGGLAHAQNAPGPSPAKSVTVRHSAGHSSALRMSPAIVCRSIDGYEAYERMPTPELTVDEKLLIYYRPLTYETALVDGSYQAHFTQDGLIRRRGEKTPVRQKQRLLDCTAKGPEPPRNLYLRNTVSLKGLEPGEYDFVIMLHDENAKGSVATQVVKFRVVAATDVAAHPADEKLDDGDSSASPKPKAPAPSTRAKPDDGGGVS